MLCDLSYAICAGTYDYGLALDFTVLFVSMILFGAFVLGDDEDL